MNTATASGIGEEEIISVFTKFRNHLLNTLFSILRNRDDALDVAQIAFMKCWKNRELWSEIKNAKSWIFRIAVNAAKDYRRDYWIKNFVGLPLDGVNLTCSKFPFVEIEQRERIEVFDKVVNSLPEGEREVFLLRKNRNMTCKEISQSQGIPLGTVNKRMSNAMSRIKRIMAHRGISND